MQTTVQSDTARLLVTWLKHPREVYRDAGRVGTEWRSLGYRAAPDPAAVAGEFERFVTLLDDAGVETRFVPAADDDTLDAIYVRDAAVATDAGLVLGRMGKPARRGEPAALKAAFVAAGEAVAGVIAAPARLEGGDMIWLDRRTPVVGLGYRTNIEGARQLRAMAGDGIDGVVTVALPHWRGEAHCMHLMSLLSPLDADLLLVYSPLLPVNFRDYLVDRGNTLVEVPDEEFDTLGCNVLAIAPRRCIAISGNSETRRRLEAAGVEVLVFDGDQVCRNGEGGPTCLTRPMTRRIDG